jgi:cysteine synthase A
MWIGNRRAGTHQSPLRRKIFEIGQFVRQDNLLAHYDHTGPEIWEQTGRQTGRLHHEPGHRRFGYRYRQISERKKNLPSKSISPKPAESPILAYGKIGKHKVQGVADGLIPEILDLQYIDGIILVSSEQSVATAQKSPVRKAFFCGIPRAVILLPPAWWRKNIQ